MRIRDWFSSDHPDRDVSIMSDVAGEARDIIWVLLRSLAYK